MALSVRKVETAKPGRHGDGGNLFLEVRATGARSWLFRFQMEGKRRDMGMGSYPAVGLAEARAKAQEARRLVAQGIDPIAARKRQKRMTFKAAAEALIELKQHGWRTPKTKHHWTASLENHVYPTLGDVDVGRVGVAEVLAVVEPIWFTKPQTAKKVRERIEAVLDFAKTRQYREGENPARWRGNLEHSLPAPSKVKRVEHYAALPWREAPAFIQRLAKRNGVAAKALAFTILTAARSNEVRSMRWHEVDLANAVWTVGAGRMKKEREHRVPLTTAALELLGESGEPDDLVFGSEHKEGQPLTDVAVTAVIRRLGDTKNTVHGFRSSFRDWAAEATTFQREAIEKCLAHQLSDSTERAYQRGDMFDKRREIMEAWAAYLAPTGDVVPTTPRKAS